MTTGGAPAALVTGGTGRIGREVVAGLAARGWDVAIHCHAALAAARALAVTLGGRSLAVTADLREEGAVRALVHRVCDHFGRLDAVVLCARRALPAALAETTADDLRAHFDVNVGGAFVVAQEAGLAMVRQESGGTIVIVGDAPAEPPRAGTLPGSVSRAALPALARALAAELAPLNPHVRVVFTEGAAAAAVAAVSHARPAGGT